MWTLEVDCPPRRPGSGWSDLQLVRILYIHQDPRPIQDCLCWFLFDEVSLLQKYQRYSGWITQWYSAYSRIPFGSRNGRPEIVAVQVVRFTSLPP
jgi:hypothetical protein